MTEYMTVFEKKYERFTNFLRSENRLYTDIF